MTEKLFTGTLNHNQNKTKQSFQMLLQTVVSVKTDDVSVKTDDKKLLLYFTGSFAKPCIKLQTDKIMS